MDWLVLLTSLIITIFVAAVAALVLWAIVTGQIDLSQLISEESGKASLSRFQFLVFALVIASSFLFLTLQKGAIPAVSTEVLFLFGISGASYLISKAIEAGGGRRR